MRVAVASTLARLGAGESWELRGFRTAEERQAYEELVAEIAAARDIAVTIRGDGTSLVVVRSV